MYLHRPKFYRSYPELFSSFYSFLSTCSCKIGSPQSHLQPAFSPTQPLAQSMSAGRGLNRLSTVTAYGPCSSFEHFLFWQYHLLLCCFIISIDGLMSILRWVAVTRMYLFLQFTQMIPFSVKLFHVGHKTNTLSLKKLLSLLKLMGRWNYCSIYK